jgi:two-component system, OmpR family, phosphate regulon response regulator PhoB
MTTPSDGRSLNESIFMPKILVVDDDIHATTLFKTILTAKGFDAFIVNDSAVAVQTADSTDPDLIILDLMMPEPNGFEVCKMLRADPKYSRTPIVIFTAMGDSESKALALDAGANEYLTKPFRVEDLMERIQTLIDQAAKN